jgi:hypothetical protein
MTVKFSQKIVEEFLNNYGFKVLSKYKDVHLPLGIEDNLGYRYSLGFGSFKECLENDRNYNPLKFSKQNIHTFHNIKLWLFYNKKQFEFMGGEWITNATSSLYFKCNNCGESWDSRWSVIFDGGGCPFCNTSKRVGVSNCLRTDRPDLVEEWDYKKDGELTPDNVSRRSEKCVWWKCKRGHSWKTSVFNRNNKYIEYRSNCPKCKMSYGERMIEYFLYEWEVDFIMQKRFSDCRNKRTLPFDFFLPKYNLCIEYHGIQHYSPTSFGSSKKNPKREHKELQIRDEIKRNYCENKKIRLLTIPYWGFENIKKILTKVINL